MPSFSTLCRAPRIALTLALALTACIEAGCQTVLDPRGGAALVMGATVPGDALGALAVRIGNSLPTSRHITARLVDVDHVEIVVTASDAQVQRRTIAQSEFVANGATATFTGLAVGQASVEITAYDADAQSLGTLTKTAAIAAGQPTSLEATLTLNPTMLPPTGTLMGTVTMPFFAWSTAVDHVGDVWVAGGNNAMVGQLVRLNAAGKVVQSLTLGQGVDSCLVDADDHVWVRVIDNFLPSQSVQRVDKDGTLGAPYPFEGGEIAMALSLDQRVWALGNSSANLFKPDGTVEKSIPLVIPTAERPNGFCVGSDGQLWVTTVQSGQVWHFSSTGVKGADVAMPPGFLLSTIAPGADGTVWALGASDLENKAFQFSPTGALLKTVSFDYAPRDMQADAAGRLWVGLAGGGIRVLQADGTTHQDIAVDYVETLSIGPFGVWTTGMGSKVVTHVAP